MTNLIFFLPPLYSMLLKMGKKELWLSFSIFCDIGHWYMFSTEILQGLLAGEQERELMFLEYLGWSPSEALLTPARPVFRNHSIIELGRFS